MQLNDYTGPTGGLIAGAVITAWAAATAFWVGVGAILWRVFFEPRVKDLKEQIEREREDNKALQHRIDQLETLLLLHGPQQLRQAMQAVASEIHMDRRGEG